ncbi:FtsX-like permease family protein [Actinoplanes solisilvae]|uniref:FtsX-like permease family protein n=1 Tax=Actinoplanes solisilvae TaxID=2486853 RepID=UPI000FDBA287|nr:FtsX-like permease family protein [Actinoplanes solisilvae]
MTGRTGRTGRVVLLGVRLALTGGREAAIRLLLTGAGVALGVALMLLALSAQTAVAQRAERIGWQDAATVEQVPADSADAALFLAVSDYHDGTPMTRAYVAALGPEPPVPPGLDRLPQPGEVAFSPGLRTLIAAYPALGERFPGRDTLTITPDGLGHTDELVAVIGRTPADLQAVRSVREVHGFGILPSGNAFFQVYRALLLTSAVILLAPVVLLVVTASRISAGRRASRLAALRLAGATRAQTAVVAATETAIGAAVGVLLGWLAYLVARRVLAATFVFDGGRLPLDDLRVRPWIVAAALVGAPLLTVLAAAWRSPVPTGSRPPGLGTRGGPTAWTALPLAAGPALVFAGARPLGALITVVGVVVAGPYLCVLAGRGLARLSRGVPSLIAARRIAADPGTTFRAVGGVALAAWAATVLGSTTGALTQPSDLPLRPGVVHIDTGGASAAAVAALVSPGAVLTGRSFRGMEVPCADLAQVVHVTCPHRPDGPRVESTPGAVIGDLFVPTDGTLAAENALRTTVATLIPNAIVNSDRDPVGDGFTGQRGLALAACLFVLVVGACSLTAGTLGALAERRRPFAVLRASGVHLGELRRVVLLETAATMTLTTVAAFGAGLLTAYAMTRTDPAQWHPPQPTTLALLAAGILAALLLAAAALPLLGPVTRPDSIRYE